MLQKCMICWPLVSAFFCHHATIVVASNNDAIVVNVYDMGMNKEDVWHYSNDVNEQCHQIGTTKSSCVLMLRLIQK